jgi:O-acetyl-ADP-ribose deacetylase (regulator of RNase III)
MEGKNEAEKLASCYTNALHIASSNGCKTIAFPNISTGIYRFKDKVAEIALTTVQNYIQEHPYFETIIFVCFDEENYEHTNRSCLNYYRIAGVSNEFILFERSEFINS